MGQDTIISLPPPPDKCGSFVARMTKFFYIKPNTVVSKIGYNCGCLTSVVGEGLVYMLYSKWIDTTIE
jgi:hypothetical protein